MVALPSAGLAPRAAEQMYSTSQQPNMWASECITFGLATVSVMLRVSSRHMTGQRLWWDDYIVMGGYTLVLVWLGLIILWINKGLGVPIEEYAEFTGQSIDDVLYANKLILYIAELFYATALYLGKMGVLAFYWRMFKSSTIRLPIQILAVCATIWITIRTFISIFHCVPVRAFWDSNVEGNCPINDAKFLFGTLMVHLFLDLCIMSLPITELRKLQLPRLQKLGVTLMFMFGIVICITAIFTIYYAWNFPTQDADLTMTTTPIIIWCTAEMNLVTTSACIPVSRPAVRYLIGVVTGGSRKDGSSSPGYGGTSSYGLSHATKGRKRGQTTTTHIRTKKHDDDSGSTYELANSINQPGSEGGEFDAHALDGPNHNNKVIIMGTHLANDSEDSQEMMENGIMVKSETTVTHSASKAYHGRKDDGF